MKKILTIIILVLLGVFAFFYFVKTEKKDENQKQNSGFSKGISKEVQEITDNKKTKTEKKETEKKEQEQPKTINYQTFLKKLAFLNGTENLSENELTRNEILRRGFITRHQQSMKDFNNEIEKMQKLLETAKNKHEEKKTN